MLAEGLVDRVLTLCPSNTIEHGLTEKFKILARDKDLISAMPQGVNFVSPSVINASVTIVEGSICVENYHAVLEHVNSSIRESLRGKGEKTLILNDEAHHVTAASGQLKKWKQFLNNADFGFRRIVGVSGTCYLKNQYFVDVVSRYSLRQAIEDRIVKDVEYVTEGPSLHDPKQRWQVIHDRHINASKDFENKGIDIRPLTIVVTNSIRGCNNIADELIEYIQNIECISNEQANEKVITVTSSRGHVLNVVRLKTVDNPESKVEWIISVSMLTEGWDVKNVFQIVPHDEERAFDSKLLIAQVLGRGLRVPDNWKYSDHPIVTVFNHDAWAARIKSLVDEILEIDKHVSCVVIPDSKFNFEIHNLDYEQNKSSKPTKKIDVTNLFEQRYVELPTLLAEVQAQIQFDRIGGKKREEILTIRHKTFTALEIVDHMHEALRAVDNETADNGDPEKRTQYASLYSLEKLTEVVIESVNRVGIDVKQIPEEARQIFLRSLGALQRRTSRRVSYNTLANKLICKNTRERQINSCSAAQFKNDKAIFYRSDCEKYLSLEQKEFFKELIDIDSIYRGNAFSPCENDHYFKTPLNLVIADSIPERKFIRALCDVNNAKAVDCWIKNTDTGFYAVEYAWSKMTTRKKGASHIKRGMFSPDFFIKQKNWIFVVEIKDDSEIVEPSQENIKKHEYATAHFDRLNNWLIDDNKEDTRYQFTMLTPLDYDVFFTKLRKNELNNFSSHLDVAVFAASN